MIKDKNIDPNAAISGSKVSLAGTALASGKLFVGSSGGVAAAQSLSGDATLAASGALTIADSVLDGSNVANSAAAAVIGALPVVFRVALATTGATTTNTDIVTTHKIKVLDAWTVKTSAAAANNDANTVQVLSTADAITDALSIRNKADKALTRFTEIDDANATIAAGGTLRIARVLSSASDDNACEVYVLAVRVA